MGDIEIIIKRIRDRRLELGVSYQDLEDLTGLSKSTIQRYETSGIKKVPVNHIEDIAKALHVTPKYLMGWDDEKGYYTDVETAKMAQQIHDNPALGFLFDAAKDASPEDLKMAADILNKIKNK